MKKGLSKGSKRFLIWGGIGLALVVAILVFVNSLIPKKEVLPQVGAVEVGKGDVKEQLDVTGMVVSMDTKMFFSPVNAKIEKMDAKVGEVVQKGTQLVTFDVTDLEENNKKAELNVQSGQLDYSDALNQDQKNANKKAAAQTNAQILQGAVNEWQAYVDALRNAINQANVDASNDAVDAADAAATAQVAQYNQAVEQYNTELSRLWAGYEAKLHAYNEANTKYAVAQSEYDNAVRNNAADKATKEAALNAASQARSSAEAELNKAEQAYNSMANNVPSMSGGYDGGAGAAMADTYDLQAELESASAYLAELKGELAQEEAIAEADTGGLSAETKEKMQIGTDLAGMEAKSIEELIAEGKKGISAEFTGVISSVSAATGASVGQGMELFVLQSTEKVSVEVKVSKYDYAKVKEGQKATITLANNEYQGTVEKMDRIAMPDAQGNPTIKATIRIDNPDENVFLGVEAKVVIQVAEANDALIVPNEVVNIGKEGAFCYIIEEGVIVKRPVETGVASTTSLEITSGLKAGDKVITDIGDLQEGDKVEGVDPAQLEVNPLSNMMMVG